MLIFDQCTASKLKKIENNYLSQKKEQKSLKNQKKQEKILDRKKEIKDVKREVGRYKIPVYILC